jgi:uncharacterized protein
MSWLNEPRNWKLDGERLTVVADPGSDFWRKTHYGFIRDSGHFFYESVTGDFQLETEFSGKYAALYDQAGAMIRLDESVWLKTGIEYVNGVHYVSAVVTRDFSDWSVLPFRDYPGSLRLRLKREGGSITIEYLAPSVGWVMFRTAYLSPAEELQVGRTVAAPDGPGFETVCSEYRVTRAAP